MSNHLSFKEWVVQFTGEDSAKGDLASDVKRDSSFPVDTQQTEESIIEYLMFKGACRACLNTFEEVWVEYSEKVLNI